MKVCHIIIGHDRHDTRVARKICTSLAQEGYEVTLICADGEPDEIFNNVKIHSVDPLPNGRIDEFLRTKKFMLRDALNVNAKIYHLHEPCLLRIVHDLKKNGKIVIFDSHEDTPKDVAEKQYIPAVLRKTVSALYTWYERYICKKIDGVIGTTPAITERLSKCNLNVVTVYNFPVLDELKSEVPYERRDNTICFAGHGEPSLNLDKVAQACQQLDVKFRFASHVFDLEYLNRVRILCGKNPITILKNVSYQRVLDEIYSKSTIGIALFDYMGMTNYKTGTLGNTKIFEYMMAGLPMVVTDFVLWKEIIDKFKCGICVDPHSIPEIKNAIVYLINNKKEAKEMGLRGLEAARSIYNWEQEKKKLLTLYSQIEIKKEIKR